jgi:hydrogenase nickel incorporation protein HypA/HybF
VRTAERHAAGRPVRAISLQVGALRQVVPDALELYVEVVGRGTVCEGARLELEVTPALLGCCVEWEPPSFRCPVCGGGGAVVQGGEFLVESIAVEEEAEGCIART